MRIGSREARASGPSMIAVLGKDSVLDAEGTDSLLSCQPMGRPLTKRLPERPPAPTPMIGALLRLPHQAIVARIQAALAREGLDITLSELGVFLFPGPDGRRPIDLARQCAMTRQAMNYVLAGLEGRAYLERHDAVTSTGRLVRVTERGRRAIVVIR